ncbi:MAG: hypothetical protein NWE84_02045, partial [Candidatus Bathyarchaeota archaeon]|nr:hypothetical protein [Candidatus Bathyarchaeota archaeon]
MEKKFKLNTAYTSLVIGRAQPIPFRSCERKNCVNWKDGRCSLKSPEKDGETCLHFEEAMNFLRLKADAIKGSLG